MALSLNMSIEDGVSEPLVELETNLRPERLTPVLARECAKRTRQHLFRLDSERANTMGGARTHFYGQCGRSVGSGMLSDGFYVSINHIGFRQRLFGGTIRPVKAKMLTIPACAEAYGHRAREFSDLRFAILKGYPALVQAGPKIENVWSSKTKRMTRRKTKVTVDKVMFWLARSVYQGPDPSVLPSWDDYRQTITETLDRETARASRRAARRKQL